VIICLPANQAKAEAASKEWDAINARTLAERAASRKKEIADSGDSDFTRIKAAEGRFIQLAIHQDYFLDDAAIQTDLFVNDAPYWKSRYENPVGVVTASVYGNAPRMLYTVADNYAALTPFTYEAEEVVVPRLSLTQDIDALGLREAGLRRQAEFMQLAHQKFVLNIAMNQPLGTDIATTITNYTGTSPYTGRTVYVADTGVRSCTYETTNILDMSAEGGLTPAVLEALQTQAFLQGGRTIRTLHVPVEGLCWRKFLRSATVVANSAVFGAGVLPNAGLKAIPEAKWADVFDSNLLAGKSFNINYFGQTWKIKANNLLPQGYCLATTDQPMVEVFNIMSKSVSTDLDDPRDSYFTGHYEKREIAIAQPDPWLRNFIAFKIGATSNL
jgi:hypothetical protein